MAGSKWAFAVVLVAAALTGCIGDGEPEQTEVGPTEVAPSNMVPAAPQAPLALQGTECVEGGGHSVHPQEVTGFWSATDILPGPWVPADVIEDVGEQYAYSEVPDPADPKPDEGETWGHYHATVVCTSWTLNGEDRPDLLFGFVGPKVETPPFAGTAADNEYLATVIATNDPELYEALQLGGVDAMWAHGYLVQGPSGVVEVAMDTHHNGDYLSIFEKKDLGALHTPHVRIWFQHENPDGTFSPIAIDMYSEGGTHLGAEGQGYFHHSRNAHHWPLPGAHGKTAALMYEGFDRTFEWGPRPDIVLEDAYEH